MSCNQGHAKVTIDSALRVVTGKLAAIPARRLLRFLLSCITGRPMRHVLMNFPGRVGGRTSRGVGGVRPFIHSLGGGLPSVPIRCMSRHFASILTRQAVLRTKLGGGSHRGGTLISRVDTAVVLRACLRGGHFSFLWYVRDGLWLMVYDGKGSFARLYMQPTHVRGNDEKCYPKLSRFREAC